MLKLLSLGGDPAPVWPRNLRSGRYRWPEDVVGGALRSLYESADAVREMLEFAEANCVSLNGVSVKQLIHEGRRF